MIDGFQRMCDETARAALAGDQEAFGRSLPLLMQQAQDAPAAGLTAAPPPAEAISTARTSGPGVPAAGSR